MRIESVYRLRLTLNITPKTFHVKKKCRNKLWFCVLFTYNLVYNLKYHHYGIIGRETARLTVIIGRSEGAVLNSPAGREDDKVTQSNPFSSPWTCQHSKDGRVLGVEQLNRRQYGICRVTLARAAMIHPE